MNRAWCSPISDGIRLSVQVTPNARKSEVAGVSDDMLRIRLQAQPIEGKANEALIRYIADMLDVPKKAVLIAHGVANRRKILEVRFPGLTAESAMRRLMPSDFA